MPTYAYECATCKESVVITRSITELETKPACTICNQLMVRDYRINGVAFKGNGWGKQAR